MNLNSDVLYDNLLLFYKMRAVGKGIPEFILHRPRFMDASFQLQDDAVYVVRAEDLTGLTRDFLDSRSLVICLGDLPEFAVCDSNCTVFFISDDIPLTVLFNDVQSIYDKYDLWLGQLNELVKNGSDVTELVRISIPIFENCICVTDYKLNTIALCRAIGEGTKRCVEMYYDFEILPPDFMAAYKEEFEEYSHIREPFFSKSKYGNDNDNYCINLFLQQNIYMGNCTLGAEYRPFRQSDYPLFEIFSNYIYQALTNQQGMFKGRFVTLKSIFSDLLNNLPVNSRELESVLRFTYKKPTENSEWPGIWYCIAIKSANRGKSLPSEYIGNSIEEVFPGCIAIPGNEAIAVFCQFSEDTQALETIMHSLGTYLEEMNFRAGISYPFTNVFVSAMHYSQACCALEIGLKQEDESLFYPFVDYALPYLLSNACGDIGPEYILPPGLLKLRNKKGGVDYWETLRCYLDNSCDVAATAKELFIHRSTLPPRLARIGEYVQLDTPSQRLYIQLCIHLYDCFVPRTDGTHLRLV